MLRYTSTASTCNRGNRLLPGPRLQQREHAPGPYRARSSLLVGDTARIAVEVSSFPGGPCPAYGGATSVTSAVNCAESATMVKPHRSATAVTSQRGAVMSQPSVSAHAPLTAIGVAGTSRRQARPGPVAVDLPLRIAADGGRGVYRPPGGGSASGGTGISYAIFGGSAQCAIGGATRSMFSCSAHYSDSELSCGWPPASSRE
jgi:hypothetical protein